MIITCPKCSAKYQIPSEITLKQGKKLQCSACQHIFNFVPEVLEQKSNQNELLPPEDAVLSITSKTERVTVQTSYPQDSQGTETPALLPEAFRPVHLHKPSHRFRFLEIILCLLLLIFLVGIGWLGRDWLRQDFSFERNLMQPASLPVRTPPVASEKKVPKKRRLPLVSQPVLPVVVEPVFDEEEVPLPVPSQALSIQSVRFRQTPTGAVLIEGSLKNISSETLPVPEKVYALAYGENGALLFEKEIYLPKGVLYPDMEQAFFGTYASVGKGVQWVDVVLKK